jgi:hypothetical protein
MAEDILKTFKIHLERAETLTSAHVEAAQRIVAERFPGQTADAQVVATIALVLATNLQTSKNA